MNKQDAARKKANWLSYCLEIGWDKTDLDGLSELWDKYYYEDGNKRIVEPAQSLLSEKWISVEEGLPEDIKDKQVWVKGEIIPFVAHYLNKKYFKDNYDDEDYMEEGWYLSHSLNIPNDDPITVTHWQPLPSPPTK